MQRIGRIAIIVGVVLVAAGLLAGFPVMMTGSDSAVPWLALVPVGFLGLMIGTAISLMS